MHYVTHLATEGAASTLIPSWINEGLSEYMNPESTASYTQALRQAASANRLLPVTSMSAMPGTSSDVILFYGQSRSLVQFLVETYGAEKLQQTLNGIRSGRGIDQAMQEAYGFDRAGLDARWRQAAGFAPAVPSGQAESLPTPISWPTVVPFGAEAAPATASSSPEPRAATTAPASSAAKGGLACSRPSSAGGATLDLALLAFLGGMAALVLRRLR